LEGLNVVVCPVCQRPVTDADASFCSGCGSPLGPPKTIDLEQPEPAPVEPAPVESAPVEEVDVEPTPVADPVVEAVDAERDEFESPPVDVDDVTWAPSVEEPPPSPPRFIDNRKAAFLGLMGASLAIIGAFQKWLSIRISGFSPPGSAQTGWRGGDGRTIVVAAVVAGLAAGALFVGRRELWLKIALLIAGGVTIVIAVVHMVDAGSKARDIEMQFGIPAGDVRAQIGAGLYLVIVGGVGLLAAGLQARTAS
jgi:hypothetical protein